MTVLHSARPEFRTDEANSQIMEKVPHEVVNTGGSVGSSGDTILMYTVKANLGEGEKQTLVELSGESIAKVFNRPFLSERVVDESKHIDVVGDLEEGGQKYLSSTPVKNSNGVAKMPDSSKFPSESLLKRPDGVAFMINQEEDFIVKWFSMEK